MMNADEEQTSSLKLIGKSVLYVALAVAIFLGTFQVVKFAAGTETPLLVVVSRSMEPTLRVGDLVVIRHFDPDELVVGDIIVFHNPTGQEELIVHRIDEVTVVSDDRCFLTKGDNNPQQDQRAKGWPPICPDMIEGRTLVHIPVIGNISLFMDRLGDAKYVLILALALLIVISDVWPKGKKQGSEDEEAEDVSQLLPARLGLFPQLRPFLSGR